MIGDCVTANSHQLSSSFDSALRSVYLYLCSRIQNNKKEPLLLALVLDQTLIYVKRRVLKLNLATLPTQLYIVKICI